LLHYSQYHPVSEQFSAFFPMFLPCFSKCAHYRVTLFTLFLVELHKAVRLFVGRLLNRLIPPPPTAAPHRTGALCRCATSPRTAGSHPLQGRLIGYIFFAPLAKGGKRRSRRGGARSAYAKKQRPSADRRCLAWNTIIFSAPDALCRPYTAARPWAPVRCRLPASCFPERR
jgi:hypothetical protein